MENPELKNSTHSVQITNLAVYMAFVRAIELSHNSMEYKVQIYFEKANSLNDLKNDFSYFMLALKHFIPKLDMAIAARIFLTWTKQYDFNDAPSDSLTRVFLEILSHEDLRSAGLLLLSDLSLSRPVTPRKVTSNNIDFRKRSSYMVSNGTARFKGKRATDARKSTIPTKS